MIYKREEFVEENPENKKFPVKHIEQLSPIDGSQKKFIGRVNMGIQTAMGVQTLPVTFEIEAETIEGAFTGFEARAEEQIEKAKHELESQIQEMRHQAQSRIVMPGDLALGDLGKLTL